ncbi:hypothetical protein NDN08_006300 [Rhodosorus marinus]|uniref:Uncharacterized protein n=1 Tax=Rhodosorus marinus TaxID=101924 RepID=A0AAV8UN38_9RHOD|nr:hypothetical protein NDN08_006300 [Rhodosorus marinus]
MLRPMKGEEKATEVLAGRCLSPLELQHFVHTLQGHGVAAIYLMLVAALMQPLAAVKCIMRTSYKELGQDPRFGSSRSKGFRVHQVSM